MVKKGMLLKDQAVRSGSVAWIKRHFALRPWLVKNINSVSYDAKGSTALHLAAEWGQLEMCAFLMEKGADPRSDISTKRKKDKMKETAQISISPLGSALLCQTSIYKKVNLSTQKDIIKMFILDPNDINAENSKGSYMLQLCERLSTHYVKGVEDLAVYCFDHFQAAWKASFKGQEDFQNIGYEKCKNHLVRKELGGEHSMLNLQLRHRADP
eukprot:CFRG4025T1